MGPIWITRDIDAPRERVYELIADLSARPSFTDHFVSDLRLERVDPVGQGAAARMHVGAPGGVDRMETVIAEAEPPYRILERGRGARMNRVPVNALWELKEAAGGITELTLTFWTEPSKPIDRIRDIGAERWWRRRWSKALNRLVSMAEEGATPEAGVAVGGSDRMPVA